MSELKKVAIDLTPTWEQILPVLFTVLEDGNEEGKVMVREEIVKMAQVADRHNEFVKEYRVEAKNIIDSVLPILKKTKLNFSNDKSKNNVKEWEMAHDIIKQLRKDLR